MISQQSYYTSYYNGSSFGALKYSYCSNNPVIRIDPTGMEDEPIYNLQGDHIGDTKEGFTGTVLIYSGSDDIDFSNMSASEAMQQEGVDTYDNQRNNLSGDAKSNIWTNIASHFEGLQVLDEKFTMNDLEGGKIGFKQSGENWLTKRGKDGKATITGTDNYKYETTVENIASSIISHEWYSHIKKGNGDATGNHACAYENVIDNTSLFQNTTDKYKQFNVRQLNFYSKMETGRGLNLPYRNMIK